MVFILLRHYDVVVLVSPLPTFSFHLCHPGERYVLGMKITPSLGPGFFTFTPKSRCNILKIVIRIYIVTYFICDRNSAHWLIDSLIYFPHVLILTFYCVSSMSVEMLKLVPVWIMPTSQQNNKDISLSFSFFLPPFLFLIHAHKQVYLLFLINSKLSSFNTTYIYTYISCMSMWCMHACLYTYTCMYVVTPGGVKYRGHSQMFSSKALHLKFWREDY